MYIVRITEEDEATNNTAYRCQKIELQTDFYDPFEPLDTSKYTLSANWEGYDHLNHKCGQTVHLKDKYVKYESYGPFGFDFIVDIWDDRCIDKENKVYELLYDANGNPAACKNHSVDSDEAEGAYYYLNNRYLAYDISKDKKYSGLIVG